MSSRGHRLGWALSGVLALAGAAGPSAAVTVTEAPDWVAADAYYHGSGPQPDPPYAWPVWPVVRFDVRNDSSPLGVYALMVGARPGSYDWSGSGEPAMQFGRPWIPIGDDHSHPAYLPQKENLGSGPADPDADPSNDGTIDWTTQLLPVQREASGARYVDVYDGGVGSARFTLPAAFDGYSQVYWFETTGPFMACANAGYGGCYRDSVPIPLGGTFSFYVTGGLASPVIYLDAGNYGLDGDGHGVLLGSYAGLVQSVPEPATGGLLVAGLALLTALRRRRRGG